MLVYQSVYPMYIDRIYSTTLDVVDEIYNIDTQCALKLQTSLIKNTAQPLCDLQLTKTNKTHNTTTPKL